MKTTKTLSFFAPSDIPTLIQDHEALKNGIVRYVGRRWDKEESAFIPTVTPSQVIPMHEYRAAAQRGELVPANQETADYCGVPYAQV